MLPFSVIYLSSIFVSFYNLIYYPDKVEPLIPIATDESNKLHCNFQFEKEYEKLNEEYEITGVGYKENCTVPIIEESQKLFIGEKLAKKGIIVTLRDKKHMLDCVKLEYGDMFFYEEI
jgi:hypothetical protein